MGTHPINLAVRFLLELSALFSMGFWGWKSNEGILRFLVAIGLPLFAVTIWGVFAVPNDPSRSGSALVPTHGVIRLAIEFLFFGFASWALLDAGFNKLSLILLTVVIVHYAISYDRIKWLIK